MDFKSTIKAGTKNPCIACGKPHIDNDAILMVKKTERFVTDGIPPDLVVVGAHLVYVGVCPRSQKPLQVTIVQRVGEDELETLWELLPDAEAPDL